MALKCPNAALQWPCLQACKAQLGHEIIFSAACRLHREQIVQFRGVPSTNLHY